MARKPKASNVVNMVNKPEKMVKYLDNLCQDGSRYIILFYPIGGEGFIKHNFDGTDDNTFLYEVAGDLVQTAMEVRDV